jgi:hypothetical protein
MSFELLVDVANHAWQIALVNRRNVVTPRPPHGSDNEAIRPSSGDGLCQSHEITDSSIGAKAHEQMDVIR